MNKGDRVSAPRKIGAKVRQFQLDILAALTEKGPMRRVELSELFGSSKRSTDWALRILAQEGRVFLSGSLGDRFVGLTLEDATAAAIRARKERKARRRSAHLTHLAALAVPPPKKSETRLRTEEQFELEVPAGREAVQAELGPGRVVRLPVIRADEVRFRSQLFWCARWEGSLSAKACLGRQERAQPSMSWVARRAIGGGGSGTPVSPITYARCGGCPVGAIVAKRLGVAS